MFEIFKRNCFHTPRPQISSMRNDTLLPLQFVEIAFKYLSHNVPLATPGSNRKRFDTLPKLFWQTYRNRAAEGCCRLHVNIVNIVNIVYENAITIALLAPVTQRPA